MFRKLLISIIFSTLASAPVWAISASYRAQLERSGCTQQSELDGTCNVHKSKAENLKAAASPAMVEREAITGFLRDNVEDKKAEEAYSALEGNGFDNTQPLTWVKGTHTVKLEMNDAGVIYAATLVK